MVLEDQANSTKSAVTSLKVGRNTSCGPMKASFLCGVQVIQQVQEQGLQGIGGLKEVFHGATNDYLFFRDENFRKQKQDKLRIYLQDSCQLRSSCRIHIQPLFRFTCLYFPCPSPGVPKHQLLCRELAPPRKKNMEKSPFSEFSETSGMFWYGPGFTFANL